MSRDAVLPVLTEVGLSAAPADDAPTDVRLQAFMVTDSRVSNPGPSPSPSP